MKKKILVFGLTSVIGRTESYLRSLLNHFPLDEYDFDFICVTDKKASLEDEFNLMFNDGKNYFYYVPNMKKHYIQAQKWLKEFYDTHIYYIFI